MTAYGTGVAFFAPFSMTHFAFRWRPIGAFSLGDRTFAERLFITAADELRWVWLPSLLAAAAALSFQRIVRSRSGGAAG